MIELDVIVRCKNEMPYTGLCLQALSEQRGVSLRSVFFDCGSTDGSRERALEAGLPVVDVDPAGYIPGRVLNDGMRATRTPIVAFVNADAVALAPDALGRLVAPLLQEPALAATFARQTPRRSASAITRTDYARCFGDAPPPVRHGAFFSMAASAIVRRAWTALPFDEQLRYSEDVDWTTRVRALGWGVRYVPDARFEHSHDYDLRGQLRRRRGEGVAETAIFHLGAPSVWRELVRPLAGALSRDLHDGLVTPHTASIRAAQALGFFLGRREAAEQSSRRRSGVVQTVRT